MVEDLHDLANPNVPPQMKREEKQKRAGGTSPWVALEEEGKIWRDLPTMTQMPMGDDHL